MGWLASREKTIGEVPEVDLAYLAGLVDGEGCFFIYRRGATGLQICMTSEKTIDWLHQTFSGNKRGVRHPTNIKWRPSYTWALQRQADLVWLIPRLLPYLRAKRSEAQRLLNYIQFTWKNKPVGRSSKQDWARFNLERDRLQEEFKVLRGRDG